MFCALASRIGSCRPFFKNNCLYSDMCDLGASRAHRVGHLGTDSKCGGRWAPCPPPWGPTKFEPCVIVLLFSFFSQKLCLVTLSRDYLRSSSC